MPLDNRDKSTWWEGHKAGLHRIGFDHAMNNKALRPLGDKHAIIDFMDVLLYRTIARRGGLPTIRAVPIVGCPTPLLLPTEGLPKDVELQFEDAASRGLEEVGLVTSELRGHYERQEMLGVGGRDLQQEEWTGEVIEAWGEEDTGDNRVLAATAVSSVALACTLSSVADAAINTQNEVPSIKNVRIACSVLHSVAGVCEFIAGEIDYGIVGIVLIVVAWICKIVAWILEGVKGYFIDSEEGANREWSSIDRRIILAEKLRWLCQCEEDALTIESFVQIYQDRGILGDQDQEEDFLGRLLQQVSDYPASGNKLDNSVSVCMAFGGTAESYRLIAQIREWLMYAGATPEEAQIIHDWLMAARQYTAIKSRGHWLRTEHIPSKCPRSRSDRGQACWVRGSIDPFQPSTRRNDKWGDPDDRERICDRANMAVGTQNWWTYCAGYPYTHLTEFTLEDLRQVHGWLQKRLQVQVQGIVAQDQIPPPPPRPEYAATYEAIQEASTLSDVMMFPQGTKMVRVPYILKVGKTVNGRHIVENVVDQVFTVAVKPGLRMDDVKTMFRKNYVSAMVGGKYYGAVVSFPPSTVPGAAGAYQSKIETDAFKRELERAIAIAFPEPGSGGLLAGVGIAAALGVGLWLTLA